MTLNGTAAEIDAQLAKGVGYSWDWNAGVTITLGMQTTDTADNLSASDSTSFDVLPAVAPVLPVPQVSPTVISLGNLRVGDLGFATLWISNIGTGTLGVSIWNDGLQISSGQSQSLNVAFSAGTAGAHSSAVELDFQNIDAGTPLGSQTVPVSWNDYREATASVTVASSSLVAHVGETVRDELRISNRAANDGYSENLIASVTGSFGLTPSVSTTGDIAPGNTSNAIVLGLSTAGAGSFNDSVTLDLQSDGSGIDQSGTVDLGQQTIDISGTVYNYASAALAVGLGEGVLGGDAANGYTLDLGTVQLGESGPRVDLEGAERGVGPLRPAQGQLQL